MWSLMELGAQSHRSTAAMLHDHDQESHVHPLWDIGTWSLGKESLD